MVTICYDLIIWALIQLRVVSFSETFLPKQPSLLALKVVNASVYVILSHCFIVPN